MTKQHPLESFPAVRAALAAAPPIAELALLLKDERFVQALALACADLGNGFGAPEGSTARARAHHRAWITVRELDRDVRILKRRVPARLFARAQRAIDRADVMIGALPGVSP